MKHDNIMHTQIYTYYIEANQHMNHCAKLSICFLGGNSSYNLAIKKKNLKNNTLSLTIFVILY